MRLRHVEFSFDNRLVVFEGQQVKVYETGQPAAVLLGTLHNPWRSDRNEDETEVRNRRLKPMVAHALRAIDLAEVRNLKRAVKGG